MIIPSDGLIGRVSFTRNKENRPQLFETRTPEEIVVYAKENNLLHLLSLALYNNDVGFGHFPAFAKIRKGNDGYVVNLMDSKAGDIVIDADSDTMEGIRLASEERNKPVPCYLYMTGDDFAILWPKKELLTEILDEDELFEEIRDDLYLIFLEEAGVDTLHKFGKIINKAVDLFEQFDYTNPDYLDI